MASFHLATMTHAAAPNISAFFHWHQILEVSAIGARGPWNRSSLHSMYHHRCHRHHLYTTNIWHTRRTHRCHSCHSSLWKSSHPNWWSTWWRCFCTISCRGSGACWTNLCHGHQGWTMRRLLSSPCGQHSGPAVLGNIWKFLENMETFGRRTMFFMSTLVRILMMLLMIWKDLKTKPPSRSRSSKRFFGNKHLDPTNSTNDDCYLVLSKKNSNPHVKHLLPTPNCFVLFAITFSKMPMLYLMNRVPALPHLHRFIANSTH